MKTRKIETRSFGVKGGSTDRAGRRIERWAGRSSTGGCATSCVLMG